MGDEGLQRAPWTFLTSHARVLLALDRDPEARLRDVAATCHLTERTVQAVVADLVEAGYLTRVRDGRRNHYQITQGAKFRHPRKPTATSPNSSTCSPATPGRAVPPPPTPRRPKCARAPADDGSRSPAGKSEEPLPPARGCGP